jgi:dipeptidyl aminopeptidase/acylaminoacyl peptidase
MYPTEANKINEGYNDIAYAFTKVTGINKLMMYFKFTPRNWDRPKDEGINTLRKGYCFSQKSAITYMFI